MINKIYFFLLLIVCSHTAFAQNNNGKVQRAYLFSSGDTRPAAYSRPTDNTAAVAAVVTDIKSVKSVKDYKLERQVFNLINLERAKLGFTALEWNDAIAKMARDHSENMANFKFFSHKDLKGLMVNERADDCGIRKWHAIGENIAYNRGYQNPAVSAVEEWMRSPGHRENLLNNRWKESGIGIAVTPDGTYYFTEVFLRK